MPEWDDTDAQAFLDYARFFVPDRETQAELLVSLIPEYPGTFHVLDIGCGEGLLAEGILDRFEDAFVHGLDASPLMRRHASRRLAEFGDRFVAEDFRLEETEWRARRDPIHAVVSSLCIHHLEDFGKRALYRDLHDLLQPGGVLLIADLVRPATGEGRRAAAEAWDEAVKRRGQALEGSSRAWTAFQEFEWNHFHTPDDADLPAGLFEQLRWLAEAGFAEHDVFWMRTGHALFGARKD